MKLCWLGHSGFLMVSGGKKILIDPFITGNPRFPENLETEIRNPDYIVITHGHMDHLGDSPRLYNPDITKVIANVEICNWLMSQSITNCVPMNIGGSFTDNEITFTMVEAIHSSSISAGNQTIYGGMAAGFIIKHKDIRMYHFGDTAIFDNMKLIQKNYKPDIGLIPIGDRFTMSPLTAASACNDYFNFDIVIPIHYDTFPMFSGLPEDFVSALNNKKSARVLKPGEILDFDN